MKKTTHTKKNTLRACDCLAEFGAVYKYSDLLTYLLSNYGSIVLVFEI